MAEKPTGETARKAGANITVLGLVAALVAVASFAGGFFLAPGGGVTPVETAAARSVPEVPLPDFPVRTCSIAAQVSAAQLGDATVYVLNSTTNEVLCQFGSNATANSLK